MKDLIEALTILSKYENPQYPTNCSYDELFVDVDPRSGKSVEEDIKRLGELGFFTSDDDCGFVSFRFGSC